MTKKLLRSNSGQYRLFLDTIKKRIIRAQAEALRSVNKELLLLYWDLGKDIMEKQRQAEWGDAVVETLAIDLQKEFPGVRGFSARNLWLMCDLYDSYRDNQKLQTLFAEISWSHNIAILQKCKNNLEREFYIRMARKYEWSIRLLLNHIENQTYDKTLVNQTNFEHTLPVDLYDKAKLLVKDEYTFDFLELGNEYSERQLEKAIMLKIEQFLHEMGGVFAFLGRQYRLEISGKEYFIDILLYHRNLKCLVAVELKIDEFIPEYVGKMQFYLTALDKNLKVAGENPSIGIILCKTKDKTTVEYALHDSKKPIGVASYTIVKKLPEELQNQFPSLEQIQQLLDGIE